MGTETFGKLNFTGLSEPQRQLVEKLLQEHQHERYQVDVALGAGRCLKGYVVHQHVYRSEKMSGRFLASFLQANPSIYAEKTVLDLGCGSGLQGIVMSLHGASQVVFSDISVAAVANAAENIKKFGLVGNAFVVKSDLFQKIQQRFDVIVFNHPFFEATPSEAVPISIALMDPGTLLERFLKEAKDYLNPGGVIIMPFHHLAGETNNPEVQGPRYGYQVQILERRELNIDIHKGLYSIFALRPFDATGLT